jgi:hypothetical protein
VDADFIGAHAGDLGALLGISRREAMGLMLDLWTWALARAPEDRPPDGFIAGTGTVPDRLLAGSVGWTGPAEALAQALLDVGLMRSEADGYRLTGFERYKSTWEKNRRRTGRKPEGNRTGTGEEPARKTQTQTQTQKGEEKKPAPVAVAPVALVGVPPTSRKPRKEATGPAPELWRALEAKFLEVTGRPYVSGNGTVDATTVSWLLNSSKASAAEVVARWGRLLEWSKGGFPTVSGFVVLRSNWNAPQVLGIVQQRGSQPPTMSRHNWDTLPPVHVPASDATEPY